MRGLRGEDWVAGYRDVRTGMHGSETQDAGTGMYDAGTRMRDTSAQLLTVL